MQMRKYGLPFESLERRTLMAVDLGTANSEFGSVFEYNNAIYFAANDGVTGFEVYRSDGTAAGTGLFLETLPGPGSLLAGPNSFRAIEFDAHLYMSIGGQLWRTDGTQGGTAKVGAQTPGWTGVPVIYDGAMYYPANGPEGQGIYRSDGTEGGTHRIAAVKDVYALEASSNGLFFVARDLNVIVFPATGGPNQRAGYSFYVSNGTAGGTSKLNNLAISYFGQVETAKLGNQIVFTPNVSTISSVTPSDRAVYITDGTAAGTVQLSSQELGKPQSLGDEVILFSMEAVWKTDGTAGGTVKVTDLPADVGVDAVVVAGPLVYFMHGGATPYLARTDGTAGGTFELSFADGSPLVTFHGAAGDQLLFTRYRNNRLELWRTDGTQDGTQFVEAIGGRTAVRGSLGDRLILLNDEPATGEEPWISDGTDAGTHLIRDINAQPQLDLPAVAPGQPSYSTMGDTVYNPFVRVTGEAPASSTVVLFHDRTEVGRAVAGIDGTYLITPSLGLKDNARLRVAVASSNGDASAPYDTSDNLRLDIDDRAPRAVGGFHAANSIHYLQFRFDEPIDPASFSLDDIVLESLTSDLVLGPEHLLLAPITGSDQLYRITFPGFAGGILPDGEYRFTLHTTVTDRVGNSLFQSIQNTWTVRPLSDVTVALSTPLRPGAPANILSDPSPMFSGNARSGSTISLYVDGQLNKQTTTIDGYFSITARPLDEGFHTITVTASIDGVTSPHSAPVSLTIDRTAPTVTGIQFVGPRLFKVSFSEDMYPDVEPIGLTYLPTGEQIEFDHSASEYDPATRTFSQLVTGPLRPGKYRVGVFAARDHAGNNSPLTSIIISVAATMPEHPPQAYFSNQQLRLAGTDDPEHYLIRPSAGNPQMVDVYINNLAAGTYVRSAIHLFQIESGPGNDRVEISPLLNLTTKIYGGAGADSILGGSGADRVYGGEGNDWISGGLGNDTIYAEGGNDRLFGGEGRDYLDGGAGADVLRGEAGQDRIISKLGEDDHRGNSGDILTLLV